LVRSQTAIHFDISRHYEMSPPLTRKGSATATAAGLVVSCGLASADKKAIGNWGCQSADAWQPSQLASVAPIYPADRPHTHIDDAAGLAVRGSGDLAVFRQPKTLKPDLSNMKLSHARCP
jgi:hypothetical protein